MGAIITLPEFEVGRFGTWSVTSGTEDPDFPATLLADGLLNTKDHANPAKVLATSGAWLGDYGVPTREDIVFFWHSGDEDVIIHYKRGATSGVATMDGTVTLPAKKGNGHTKKVALDLTGVSGHNGATGFQYSKIEFGTNSAPPGLKVLIFSTYTLLDTGIMPGFHELMDEPSIIHTTEGGHEWGYERAGARKKHTGLKAFPTVSDCIAMRYWFEAVGTRDLTAFLLDEDDDEALIGRLGSSESDSLEIVVAPRGPTLHELNFAFREISSGTPEFV